RRIPRQNIRVVTLKEGVAAEAPELRVICGNSSSRGSPPPGQHCLVGVHDESVVAVHVPPSRSRLARVGQPNEHLSLDRLNVVDRYVDSELLMDRCYFGRVEQQWPAAVHSRPVYADVEPEI